MIEDFNSMQSNGLSPSQSSRSPQQQHYSSRNSLRTATKSMTGHATISRHSDSCRPLITPTNIDNFREYILDKGVDHDKSYEILNNECFIKIDNDELVCMLCGSRERFHSDYTIDKHLNTDKHNRQLCELEEEILRDIPPNSSLQIQSLSELLNRWFLEASLYEEQIRGREHIIAEFEYLLNLVDPQCQCRLYGSLLTGTSLQNSDINVELIHPNSRLFASDPRAKQSIHHKLVDPDADHGNQLNFHTLHYDLIPNGVDTLYKIMNMILSNVYEDAAMNPFTVQSQLCDLNKKVPKLILMHNSSQINLEISCYAESAHKLSVLLRTYMSLEERACILSILVKYWAQTCGISLPDDGTLPPDAFSIMVIHYLQRTTPPVLPCLHEIMTPSPTTTDVNNLPIGNMNLEEELDEDREETDSDMGEDECYIDIDCDEVKNLNWKSENTLSVHELFIDFMKTMMIEFGDTRSVMSIRTFKQVTPTSKRFSTVVKAIENPVKPKNDLSRCIGSERAYNFIKKCFRRTLFYLTSIPIGPKGKQKEKFSDPSQFIDIYVHKQRQAYYFDMRKSSIQNKTQYDPIGEMIRQNLFAKDVCAINYLFNKPQPLELPARIVNLYKTDYYVQSDFLSSKFCWSCRKSGHVRKSCPSTKLLNLNLDCESYNIDLDLHANLDDFLLKYYRQNQISPMLKADHEKTVEDLCNFIRSKAQLDCHLELFGSTVNDLGSLDSDLDICLILNGNDTGKGVDCVEVLSKVKTALLESRRASSVEAVFSARVPILKFRYKNFDIDLSMYNLCAIHNSKLLKAYAQIDPRVSHLFCLVKRFAKECGIADASKGTLSSYAWSLLVIHYLQQTNPPILPVLQEQHNNRKQIYGVNGWNVWFDDNIDLGNMIPNDLTITQLFKGFFLYYGNFNFELNVVSIRKFNLMTKFQKNWHHCMMAIEDPFELTYNLSSRLDDAMATYVINSFSQAFRHFVKIQEKYLSLLRIAGADKPTYSPIRDIFDGRGITGSQPPFRGCRICCKIGHRMKDCPLKKKDTKKDPRSGGGGGAAAAVRRAQRQVLQLKS